MNPVHVFLLVLFGAACGLLLMPVLRSRAAVLQFPFAAGCGLLGFLFPQALGLVRNGSVAPAGAMTKALVMCILTALAVYAGWYDRPPARWSEPARRRYPVGRLYWIGAAALGVGAAGFLKLTALNGGVVAHYSVPSGAAVEWRGLPVAYDFLAQYFVPGLALCGSAGLLLGGRLRLLLPSLVLAVQVARVVFLGRRAVLVSVLVSVACILFFGKRWLPSRRLVLCAAPLVALAMFLAPEYRKHSQIGGDIERLGEMDTRTLLGSLADGGPHEFWAMANYMQATAEDGVYECGAGVYNTFVLLFVPKLIVGEAGKAALLIPVNQAAGGWQMPYGMVPTGPGSAFRQFWFLGGLWFYGLGRLMRYLWLRATAGGDLFAQAAYTFLLTPAIASVVNDMYAIYPPVFMFWIPLTVLTSGVFPGPSVRFRGLCPAGAVK
jgi:hypothetical protein